MVLLLSLSVILDINSIIFGFSVLTRLLKRVLFVSVLAVLFADVTEPCLDVFNHFLFCNLVKV